MTLLKRSEATAKINPLLYRDKTAAPFLQVQFARNRMRLP